MPEINRTPQVQPLIRLEKFINSDKESIKWNTYWKSRKRLQKNSLFILKYFLKKTITEYIDHFSPAILFLNYIMQQFSSENDKKNLKTVFLDSVNMY